MGLFDSSSSSKATCPSLPTGSQYGTDNVLGSFTFHELTIILCGAFTAATFLVSGFQISLHATHFSNPSQQTHILRIIALAPIFAIFFFFSGFFPSLAIYLQPWADAYEAVALTSYFLLLITYAVPDSETPDEYFERLPKPKSSEGSLKWYRRTWIFVFQYIPISFIVAVATDITQAVGKYCINGNSPHFAHIWLEVIHTISVVLAFLRLLQFYRRLRPTLTSHSVTPKLIAIKGIVFFETLQGVIFTILSTTGAAKPNSKLSYDDIYFGIPSILICGEMVFFSLFNFYAYGLAPYTSASRDGSKIHYQGGPLGIRALVMALNPMEVARGLAVAVRYLFSNPAPQNYDSLPLQQGVNTNLPPAYVPRGRDDNHSRIERAHNPSVVEYGLVERYTPV